MSARADEASPAAVARRTAAAVSLVGMVNTPSATDMPCQGRHAHPQPGPNRPKGRAARAVPPVRTGTNCRMARDPACSAIEWFRIEWAWYAPGLVLRRIHHDRRVGDWCSRSSKGGALSPRSREGLCSLRTQHFQKNHSLPAGNTVHRAPRASEGTTTRPRIPTQNDETSIHDEAQVETDATTQTR